MELISGQSRLGTSSECGIRLEKNREPCPPQRQSLGGGETGLKPSRKRQRWMARPAPPNRESWRSGSVKTLLCTKSRSSESAQHPNSMPFSSPHEFRFSVSDMLKCNAYVGDYTR